MTNNKKEFPVRSYAAGHLFFLAKSAYERTKGSASIQEPGQSDAIVAIIFSASSLEAFINELPEMASTDVEHLGIKQPESVKSFSTIMNEIEESRGSTRLKFLQAHLIFTGKPYDTDKKPFQDFSNLFKLRDAFLHLKPQKEYVTNTKNKFIRVSNPKPISGLPKNILANFESKVVTDWISMVSTQASARWACNTAAEMVQSILGTLPDSHFRNSAIAAYGKSFRPIE